MKDKTTQRAIVCLYLRKRHAKHYLDKFLNRTEGTTLTQFEELNLATLRAAENEAHNALESLKRILWNDEYA
jgi:predicted negative regulator of RcsB-dependent stress response